MMILFKDLELTWIPTFVGMTDARHTVLDTVSRGKELFLEMDDTDKHFDFTST